MSLDRRVAKLESAPAASALTAYGPGVQAALRKFVCTDPADRTPDTFGAALAEAWGCDRAEADRRYALWWMEWPHELKERVLEAHRSGRLAEVDINP